LNDLTGHRGAAILQGVDGVAVTFFVWHPAKVGDDRLNRLWRFRHNAANLRRAHGGCRFVPRLEIG
jgi:hypothetical protein